MDTIVSEKALDRRPQTHIKVRVCRYLTAWKKTVFYFVQQYG